MANKIKQAIAHRSVNCPECGKFNLLGNEKPNTVLDRVFCACGCMFQLVETLLEDECICGNPELGFDCVCDWTEKNPGTNEYCCEYCGVYTAGKPRCNRCELDN